jgi:hypothetical protein
MTCKDCRFFFIIPMSNNPESVDHFECRKNTPVVIAHYTDHSDGYEKMVFGFPRTWPDSWCGEIQEWTAMEGKP